MKRSLVVWILCCVAFPVAQAQQPPQATDLPGKPFLLKKTWMIGGFSTYDFLKFDPLRLQLLIARRQAVQVVDIETGTVAGEISGLNDARDIALDDKGQFGFISEGKAYDVAVFDRRTQQIVSRLPTGPNPRALAYDSATRLIFAIGGQPRLDHENPFLPGFDLTPEQMQQTSMQISPEPGSYTASKAELSAKARRQQPDPNDPRQPPVESVITMIDADTQQTVGNIVIRGRAGFAQSDGQGRVFVNIVDQNTVVRLDAQRIRNMLEEQASPETSSESPAKSSVNPQPAVAPKGPSDPRLSPTAVVWDWTGLKPQNQPPDGLMQIMRLSAGCEPEGLAIDAAHLRLFVGCGDRQLTVINANTGALVTTLPTGLGTGVVQYDPSRNLIFVANGDTGGMLTIIHQDVNDTYNVVQNLPTAYRARVLEVNHISGEIYLATDGGQSEAKPPVPRAARRAGMSDLTNDYPVATKSSFQVLVVDH